MIGVQVCVEHTSRLDSFNHGNQSMDRINLSTFAEIGHTFDNSVFGMINCQFPIADLWVLLRHCLCPNDCIANCPLPIVDGQWPTTLRKSQRILTIQASQLRTEGM
jgi:hypothetical protein